MKIFTNMNVSNPHIEKETGPLVSITINSKPAEIHRGHQTIAAIKKLGGIPATDELEQVIHGKLTPLPDDGALTIKGGEVFISHPRDSGSS
ncbi:MAG: hypothetical protein QM790_16105 [Nibricoccus sp.]